MPTKINFDCPNCHQAIRSDTEKIVSEITCPTCAAKFIPIIPQSVKPACSKNSLHSQAFSCSILAAILLVVGIFACLANLVSAAGDGTPATWGYHLAGWSIGVAVGLQIIAQLLHIRAGLEK